MRGLGYPRHVLRRIDRLFRHHIDQTPVLGWLVLPLVLTGLGLFVHVGLFSEQGTGGHTYATLYFAVIVSSLLSGYRAGLIASLLSTAGALWLSTPLNDVPDLLILVIFLVDCLLIVAVCHAVSTTNRRVAEARAEARHALQLLKGEQLFRLFVEHAPVALALFDRDMRYIGASRRWMAEYAASEESVRAKAALAVSPNMPTGWVEAMQKALAGEVSRKEEDLIVHPDGHEQWLRWEIRPWKEASDIVAGVVVFSEDITPQKQAAIALAESELRLRAIIESVQYAMIVTDRHGNIESFNPATIALFGYCETELQGKNINLFLKEQKSGAESLKLFDAGHDETAKDFFYGSHEAEGRRKGGAAFPVDYMATKWRDAYGAVHFTMTVHDISERRAIEEELARAGRMEAVARLAGGVAHDFSNLLSVIIGNLELMEPHVTKPKTRQMIHKALEAAGRGAGFIRQLLTLARKRRSEFEDVDLNQHVSSMAVLLEHTLGSNIRLSTDLASDLWITRADPVEIDSSIINLAMNAANAMPHGGALHISTGNITIESGAANGRAGDFVRISVRDSGTGMTREVRQHAFEPFFTANESGIGTGLGLPSVYGFAQAAGGFVTLDSCVGRGTTVELYLPRLPGAERKAAAPARRQKRGHGEFILVVEDNRGVREVSIQRLERLGYRTRPAASVSEACQILRRDEQIALVFSDIMLAGAKTGYDLARWVEQNRPDVHMLLTTGYDIGDQRLVRGEANSRVRRLSKPYTTARLADEIRRALESDPQ